MPASSLTTLSILITVTSYLLLHPLFSVPSEPPYAHLLKGWYDGDSFDEDTLHWIDKTTNERNTTSTNGDNNCWNLINFNFSNGLSHKVLSGGYCGGTPAYLMFPTDLFDHNETWTFVHLTRYDDKGSYKGRIWAGTSTNWLDG